MEPPSRVATAVTTLATIDLARIVDGEPAERERLRRASIREGAFVLKGHGIGVRAGLDVLDLGRRLFDLSQTQLDAIDMFNSPYFRGYSTTGSERTRGRADLREQLDIGPEDEPHIAVPGESPYLRLRGPNLWPAALPELRPAILEWMRALRGVSGAVLAHVLDVSGFPRERFLSGFAENPHERVKIIRYPGGASPDSKQGVGEHRDNGFLSIIVHDGTAGLEVYDGRRFVAVPAAAGETIVILGSALQTATGGVLEAALHRVISPPAGSERVSIAYFLNPRLEFVLHDDPIDGHAAEYGYEALNVVLRSHPHVAERYFADLIANSTEPTCA
jgi:isopenicillin N synthase-like dioxygenase